MQDGRLRSLRDICEGLGLTAMETATLHRLFPGRAILAVGHGVQVDGTGGRPGHSPLTLLRE